MEAFSAIVIGMQALIWISIFVILVLLIFRRVELKKKEDFEKRDN